MEKLINSKSRFLTGSVFLLLILGISNGCTKSNDSMYGMGSTTTTGTGSKGAPGPNEVWIQGSAFNPSSITIAPGTSITWTNKDVIAHTATSNAGQADTFDSGTLNTNGTYSYMFNIAGTFTYYCKVHPGMVAVVVVK
jgi:plastocyanin